MAYYKLFCIVHRRTDWERLYDLERRAIYPKEYEERKRKNRMALAKLLMARNLIESGLTATEKCEYLLRNLKE